MGHQIIEQPDGKLCVFSTVVDGFVITDATEGELVLYYSEQAALEARRRTLEIIKNVRNHEPEKTYRQFTMNYEEAAEIERQREEGYRED